MRKRPTFEIGDTVAYSAAFGKSIALDGDAMRARGTVVSLTPFSSGMLVEIEWQGIELPKRVLDVNLAKPGTARFSDTYA